MTWSSIICKAARLRLKLIAREPLHLSSNPLKSFVLAFFCYFTAYLKVFEEHGTWDTGSWQQDGATWKDPCGWKSCRPFQPVGPKYCKKINKAFSSRWTQTVPKHCCKIYFIFFFVKLTFFNSTSSLSPPAAKIWGLLCILILFSF